jgi:hypothetical protein
MWGPGAIASQKSSARHSVPLKRAAAVDLVDAAGAQPVDADLKGARHDEYDRGDVHAREFEGGEEGDQRQEVEQELHAGNRENGR